MKYLDDIENVRNFYIKFCEYLETEEEKEAFIKHTTESHIPPSQISYLIYVYIRFTQSDNFKKFKDLYLTINPDLILYKEEFKYHRFNCNIFREEFEEFNNSISCLK